MNMIKFVSLALLVIFYLGDAKTLHYQRGLWESRHDETFRAAYEEAVSNFPELTTRNRMTAGSGQRCNQFGRDQIHASFYSRFHPHSTKMIEYVQYDVTKPLKIIVQQTPDGERMYTDLITAYLRHHKENVNIINIHYPKFFGCDVDQYTRLHDQVVEAISQQITSLHANGTSPDKIHLIGLGFGAHIAGSVAKMLKPLKIGRITGLDPLGGAFDRSTLLGALDAEDADFVDVISTNSRHFGTKKMRGTVQFYPNGGEVQPGSNDFGSHLNAKDYFVESIARTHAFKSEKARTWDEYNYGVTAGEWTYMGEYASNRLPGKYFLQVNSMPPYSQVGEDNPNQRDRDAYPIDSAFERAQEALNYAGRKHQDNIMSITN